MSQSKPFIISDVRIFTGDYFIEHGHVLVEGSKIKSVSVGNPLSTPRDVQVISKPGCTLLPGLIDAHIHADQGNTTSLEQSLNFGVTTVCDMSNEAWNIEKLVPLVKDPSNNSKYADYKYAGQGVTTKGGWPAAIILLLHPEAQAEIDKWPTIAGPDEANGIVKQQLDLGASYIKMMHENGDCIKVEPKTMSTETRRAVVQAAKKYNVPIVAHAMSYRATLDVLHDGVDGLAHTFMNEATSTEYIDLYKRNQAHCNPTLNIIGSATKEGHELQHRFAQDALAERCLINKSAKQQMCTCMGLANDSAKAQHAYDSVKALYKAGIPITVGSDSAGPAVGSAYGLSTHQEIYLFGHEIGMAPIDVLKAATSTTAKRFGFHDRGAVEPGKRADLLLIDGDVRNVLANKDKYCLPVLGVWREGVVAQQWKAIMTT